MKIIFVSALWCSSCIIMRPVWEEIKTRYDFECQEYDYDIDTDVLKKYEIDKTIPVIIILNKDNKEIHRFIGEKKKKEILEILDNISKEV